MTLTFACKPWKIHGLQARYPPEGQIPGGQAFEESEAWPTDLDNTLRIHVGSRRVIVTGMTAHPDARWVMQQARNFVLLTDQETAAPTHLIHDFDTKFTRAFDELLATEAVEPVKVGPQAPNLNAHAERFVLSIKSECLDHFIVFGEEHLRLLVSSYVEHYNEERPHQGVGNVPLKVVAQDATGEGEVICHERLGGLLRHYERKAA